MKNRKGAHVNTSDFNAWKGEITRDVTRQFPDLPMQDWKPLRSWPARPHHDQARIDALKAIPSKGEQSEP